MGYFSQALGSIEGKVARTDERLKMIGFLLILVSFLAETFFRNPSAVKEFDLFKTKPVVG